MTISVFEKVLSAIGISSSQTDKIEDGQLFTNSGVGCHPAATSIGIGGENNNDVKFFSGFFENPSPEDKKKEPVDELDDWVAPHLIRKNFPYFHAGFDSEGRPCWIAECGKWNARQVSEGGEDMLRDYDKFTDQLLHRLVKSMGERKSPDGSPVDTLNLFVDMDQFSFMQVAHIPTILLIYRTVGKYIPVLSKHLNVGIVVNTNAAAYRIVAMITPLMGKIMESVEIYGTNRATWVPQLVGRIPADQLPESLGGSRYFKPLKFYGG